MRRRLRGRFMRNYTAATKPARNGLWWKRRRICRNGQPSRTGCGGLPCEFLESQPDFRRFRAIWIFGERPGRCIGRRYAHPAPLAAARIVGVIDRVIVPRPILTGQLITSHSVSIIRPLYDPFKIWRTPDDAKLEQRRSVHKVLHFFYDASNSLLPTPNHSQGSRAR